MCMRHLQKVHGKLLGFKSTSISKKLFLLFYKLFQVLLYINEMMDMSDVSHQNKDGGLSTAHPPFHLLGSLASLDQEEKVWISALVVVSLLLAQGVEVDCLASPEGKLLVNHA